MNNNRREMSHTVDPTLLDEDNREAMQSMCAEYYQEGVKNGIEIIREEERIKIVKNLFLHNVDIELISLAVGIPSQLLVNSKSKQTGVLYDMSKGL